MNGIVNHFKMFWLLTIITGIVGWAEIAKAYEFTYGAPWTTVASAGTVDEADTSIVTFGTLGFPGLPNSVATIRSDAALPASLDIRYNIVAVDGLLFPDTLHHFRLTVRYRDNGPSARVLVRLRRFNMTTGATTTLMTFDSNNMIQSNEFRDDAVDTANCNTSWDFDFHQYAYWCEATIAKSASDGAPALAEIKIAGFYCGPG